MSRVRNRIILTLGFLAASVLGGATLCGVCKKSPQETNRITLPQKKSLPHASPPPRLKDLVPPSDAIPLGPEPASGPPQPPKPLKDLAEFFDKLKDTASPPPTVDFVDPRGLSIKKYRCPMEKDRNFVKIYYYGRFLGYRAIGGNPVTFDYISGSSKKAIRDNEGNIAGFRQTGTFMSHEIPFTALSGKQGKAYQDTHPEGATKALTKDEQGYIYEDRMALPLGRLTPDTNEFINNDGRVLGRIDQSSEFLALDKVPQGCSIKDSEEARTYIRFSFGFAATNLSGINVFIERLKKLAQQQNFWAEEND